MQPTTPPDSVSAFDRACSAYLRGSGLVLRVLGVLALALMVGSHALEIGWRFFHERGLSWVHEFNLWVMTYLSLIRLDLLVVLNQIQQMHC